MNETEVIRRLDAQARAIKTLRARVSALEGAGTTSVEPVPVLTPAAAKRVARGATTGAGTHVCATCRGPKEANRLNSNRCRGCDA